MTPSLINRLTDKGPTRHTLSNRFCPDAEVRGSILFEIKTRERRSGGSSETSSSTQNDEENNSRFGHIPSDYFRRDGLHGPPLPRNYERLVTSQGQVYWRNTVTKKSTWHDPRFDQHLSNSSAPLPADWEMLETATGRKYYVNHRTKTTQFTDPRLELTQSNITPSNKSQSLHSKLKSLRSELTRTYHVSRNEDESVLRIDIDRNDVFESSFAQISQVPSKYFHKRFLIKFKDEEGIDYGGVTREWLYLLSHSMLDPTYGLFEYSEGNYNLEINPNSGINPAHLSYFTFIGKVIGIAIYHGHYLDGGFTLAFYKKVPGVSNYL